MNAFTDVIAAISTPPGKGGVAVIRISGDGAFEIAEKIFEPMSKKPFSSCQPRLQIYGNVVSDGRVVDDVLAARYPSPNSYTGEDTVEICTHGGTLVTRAVLDAVFRAGAKPAFAGEFTKRAFINGKLTLNDAEAIANVLEAKSEEQLRLGGKDATGRLDAKIGNIREILLSLMSSIYARIDYPDEDLGDFDDDAVLDGLLLAEESLRALISSYKTGRAITEGISAVLCGKPNVGKSSVYNALLGKDAAIVTSTAGTTRDVLESTVPVGRVLLRLYDTAGIRGGDEVGEIEAIGIERSRARMKEAELIIAVFDTSVPTSSEDAAILEEIKPLGAYKLALFNKSDLKTSDGFDGKALAPYFDELISITANDADSLKHTLAEKIDGAFTDEKLSVGSDAIVSSARLYGILTAALDSVSAAKSGLIAGFPQDTVSSDIERALAAITESDPRGVSDEVLGDIFSKFCVGK